MYHSEVSEEVENTLGVLNTGNLIQGRDDTQVMEMRSQAGHDEEMTRKNRKLPSPLGLEQCSREVTAQGNSKLRTRELELWQGMPSRSQVYKGRAISRNCYPEDTAISRNCCLRQKNRIEILASRLLQLSTIPPAPPTNENKSKSLKT